MDSRDLKAARYAREVASAYYISNPRVTLIDIGWKITNGAYTGELAVRVHVQQKPAEAAFEVLDQRYPSLVIDKSKIPYQSDIIQATYPLHLWWNPQPASPRASMYDPLLGGISVSGKWVFGFGTLGGIVEDRATHSKMILSNWHVLAGSDYAGQGTPIFQPAYGDYGSDYDTVASLDRHAFDQGIDAAVAALNETRGWSSTQLGIGAVTGAAAPALSMAVTKSGRASGVTHGIIDGFDGEYPINYQGMPRRIKFVNRIIPRPGDTVVSQPGDSGSWWLQEGTGQAVGLHFAGQDDPETALAISMPQVLDALGVDIATGQAAGQVAAPVPVGAVQPDFQFPIPG